MSGGTRRAGGAQSVRGVNYSTSPLLASKTPPWRSRFLVLLVGLGFVVLIARALYVQVLHADFFQKKGEERYASTLDLPANRGRILDRNGQLLAISVYAPTVSINPQQFKASDEEKRELVALLGIKARSWTPSWPTTAPMPCSSARSMAAWPSRSAPCASRA
jgi:cell division protein FtsI (penicillin-binding protein 3)